MSKKILLIESDAAFARDMAAAIETRGLEARVTGDGREGLELAKANRPDAIVLCVELPKMSGYSVCNKLKKDDELKHIPLVIISAEATAATFDQHRKLKTHAEDYLLKPFDAAALLQKIAGLVELPPEPAANDTLDEEIVTLDDVEELEALSEPAADAEDLPTEGVGMALGEDEDLKLFDEAFGTLEVPDAAPADATAEAAELLAASLSDADDEPSRAVQDAADSADAALEALGLDDVAESEVEAAALLAPPPPLAAASPERTTDAFHLAPVPPPPPRPAVIVPPPPPVLADLHGVHHAPEAHGGSSELQVLQDRVSELRIELARRDEELQRSTADHAEAEQRAEAIARDSAARERSAEERARVAEERARATEEAAAAACAAAEARANAAVADAEARVGAALADAEARVSAAVADADARVSAAVAEADRAVG
ncbi:MAG: PleD family two-component system response regulator, partial [Anaeromyxobacteraceae bacterium]